MTRSVGLFYKKNLLTQGAEKANQVLKRQKAIAAVEAVTKKQTANQLGRNLSVQFITVMIHFLLFAGVMLPQLIFLSLIWCHGSRVLFPIFTLVLFDIVINKELFLRLNCLLV